MGKRRVGWKGKNQKEGQGKGGDRKGREKE
jgi:hypothetical protein